MPWCKVCVESTNSKGRIPAIFGETCAKCGEVEDNLDALPKKIVTKIFSNGKVKEHVHR